MIIVKVINQKIVQVAVANQTHGQLLLKLNPRYKKQLACFARTLVQSAPQSQKITNANNQQLIPIARNISFRQCRPNAKVSYSISASSPTSNFISAEQSIFIDDISSLLSPSNFFLSLTFLCLFFSFSHFDPISINLSSMQFSLCASFLNLHNLP